jgi:hypothetical protein
MATYRFTLQVSGFGGLDEAEAAFYGVGVDDALIYTSGDDIFLAFDRDASSEGAAIDSAANDVHARGGNVLRVIREGDAAQAG